MPTNPPSSLLQRDLSKATVREKIDLAIPLIQEVVNYGLAALMRCSIDAGGVSMRPEDESVLSLYRHVLVMVDGIEHEIAQAAVEPCDTLLRAEFEALISLLFIAEASTPALRAERGRAYVVADLKRQLGELRRLDPGTSEGKQARAKLARDDYLKTVTLPTIPDLAARIAEVETRLAAPDLSAANAEYERLRSAKGGRPNWHALFGGPATIEQLADAVQFSGSYEFLYRMWSGFVHGTDTVRERKSGSWRRLRSTTGLTTVVQLSVSFALRATRTILPIYRPGENSYQNWYAEDVRPRFNQL